MRRCFTDPHYWKNPALRRSREKRGGTAASFRATQIWDTTKSDWTVVPGIFSVPASFAALLCPQLAQHGQEWHHCHFIWLWSCLRFIQICHGNQLLYIAWLQWPRRSMLDACCLFEKVGVGSSSREMRLRLNAITAMKSVWDISSQSPRSRKHVDPDVHVTSWSCYYMISGIKSIKWRLLEAYVALSWSKFNMKRIKPCPSGQVNHCKGGDLASQMATATFAWWNLMNT